MKPVYLFAKILITGGIVLALELAASRVLTPFFGVSLYVWSAILSVTLIALALGYKFGGVLAGRLGREKSLLFFAVSGALAALWLDLCVWTYPLLFWPLSDFDLVAGSIAACTYLLFVPLVILSALNPVLVALLDDKKSGGDHGAGSVFFISTIGSVLGVFFAAYGLMPHLTNYKTIVLLAALAAGLSVLMLLMIRNFGDKNYRRALVLSVLAFVIAVGTFASGGLERFTHLINYNNKQWRMVHAAPSYFGHVQILDVYDKEGVLLTRSLLTDGLLQNQFFRLGVSANLYTYALEKMGLEAAPELNKALVLGIAAGVVPMAYANSGFTVRAVDISPEIVKAAQDFLDFQPEKMAIDYQDARIAARRCERDYDVVAVDLFRGDGVPEHLVTQEFFSDIKNCLRDQGVIVMNSFVDTADHRAGYALLKTVATVFDEVAYYVRPPKEDSSFTVAFLVARKNGPVGPLVASNEDVPPRLKRDMDAIMESGEVIKPDDARLKDIPVLSDVSNQWKHLAFASELAYRQGIVSKLPWQVLMN